MKVVLLSYDKTVLRFIENIRFTDDCWWWTGSATDDLYPTFAVKRKGVWDTYIASRISYRYFVGKFDPELEIDHLCKNTLCVRPEHLEPVPHAENMRRQHAQRVGYCQADLHDLTLPGSRVGKKGRCRNCWNQYQRDRYRAIGRG